MESGQTVAEKLHDHYFGEIVTAGEVQLNVDLLTYARDNGYTFLSSGGPVFSNEGMSLGGVLLKRYEDNGTVRFTLKYDERKTNVSVETPESNDGHRKMLRDYFTGFLSQFGAGEPTESKENNFYVMRW